jgi:uncharacterized protein (TIGR04255 family)
MPERNRTLPEFSRPPVIETVLGVQFRPVANFSIPHFGLFWAKIRDKYPGYEVQPPLGPVIEEFGEGQWKNVGVNIELMQIPEVRCWFKDSSGKQLIQLQRDRFLFNWRKVKDEDMYPRYDNIEPRFAETWNEFCSFLHEVGLEEPDVNQCEVTYVNHIDLGHGWKSYAELKNVIACWSGEISGSFLPDPESVNIGARYVLPNGKGRLHVLMQPAIRRTDAKEILQLNLTARGKPESSTAQHVLEWLDLGHKWIVRGFTDFTTKSMHEIWGRRA